MSRRANTSVCGLLILTSCVGLAGCKKAEHELSDPTQPVAPAKSGDYELTAQDMPLTDDFRKAAAKLVTTDNYRDQIARVERELTQLALREDKERKLDAEELSR